MHTLLLIAALGAVNLNMLDDGIDLNMLAAGPTISVPATAEVRETNDALSLVMVYGDNCPACAAMEPELRQLEAAGYRVTRVNFSDPKAQPVLRHYRITAVPYLLLYRGHEAVEEATGFVRALDIAQWFHRFFRGQPPIGRFRRCTAQDDLGAEGRRVLQWRMSAPSCGMNWCLTHRYWEAVEMILPPGGGTNEFPASQDARRPAASASVPRGTATGVYAPAPPGACPGGRCPVP